MVFGNNRSCAALALIVIVVIPLQPGCTSCHDEWYQRFSQCKNGDPEESVLRALGPPHEVLLGRDFLAPNCPNRDLIDTQTAFDLCLGRPIPGDVDWGRPYPPEASAKVNRGDLAANMRWFRSVEFARCRVWVYDERRDFWWPANNRGFTFAYVLLDYGRVVGGGFAWPIGAAGLLDYAKGQRDQRVTQPVDIH
jgi:hypothetical protein